MNSEKLLIEDPPLLEEPRPKKLLVQKRQDLREREAEFLRKGYQRVDGEKLQLGEYKVTVLTDRADVVGALLFVLEWRDFEDQHS